MSQDAPSGSLLSPEFMGGLIGGGGYDFQTRYIVCHFLEWTKNPNFISFVQEATGDVDLLFGPSNSREHIQIKDHDITPAVFRECVANFVRLEKQFPDVYSKFTIASPGVSPDVKSLYIGLCRFRGLEPFFVDALNVMEPTKKEVEDRISKCGISDNFQFIFDKVHLQPGLTDYHHDDRCANLFKGQFLSHPKYEERFREVLDIAYSNLARLVSKKKGNPVSVDVLDSLIDRSLISALKEIEKKITISLHNWTSEKFLVESDYALDWSTYFDRSKKRVPTSEIWNGPLKEQLIQLKTDILNKHAERLIYLQGKAALSTGIAFGATFPVNGGWTVEMPQPPQAVTWRSDASLQSQYSPMVEIEALPGTEDSIALLFNISGKAKEAVKGALESLQVRPKALVSISPAGDSGSASIRDDSEAVSLAQKSRDLMRSCLDQNKAKKTHLFFYGPLALAVFLGQRLTSVGEVQLYEFQDPGYIPSISFRT